MPTTWKGKKAVYQGEEYDLIRGFGMRVTRRYAGERNEMVSRALAHYAAGWNARVSRDPDSPVWRVEAVAQGNPSNPTDPSTSLIDTHELQINVLNPSPEENAFLRSLFSDQGGYSTPDSKVLFAAARAFEFLGGKKSEYEVRNAILNGVGYPNWPFGANASERDTAIEFALQLMKGVTHYYKFAYAYRHRFNFGTLAGITPDFVNVGSVFTTDELIATESIPTDGPDPFELPPGEWLKIAPTMLRHMGQRKELMYEYWWAEQYSRVLYPVAL